MRFVRLRRPSASLVISCLALFVALGGTVYAGTAISGKTIKKGSLPGNRVKAKSLPGNRLKKASVPGDKLMKDSVTGVQINESTLSQVPSAANATNAVNATNVASVKTFSAGASDASMVSLVKTANFELMGICDTTGEFDPPGVQNENSGTAFVIYNRSSVPAYADSEDDEDNNLALDHGVVFNYDDNGDGGEAMSTDGHFLSAASWANLQADTNDTNTPAGHNYPFNTTCHFAGAALVG
jgi:hypothetical protein